MASIAACLISWLALKSGKPCARLTAFDSIARRVISRITDSVNWEVRPLRNRSRRLAISTGRTEVFSAEGVIQKRLPSCRRRPPDRRANRLTSENAHLPGDPCQDLRGTIEHFARVGGGDNGADAGLAFGDGRKAYAGGVKTVIEKLGRKCVSHFRFAHHDRCDRRFTGAGIKAGGLQVRFEVKSVVPERLDPVWLGFENFEGRQTSRGNSRWVRGRKKKRPGAMV